MAPRQKCSLICKWGSFTSNYRAVKTRRYLTCARTWLVNPVNSEDLVAKMDCLCASERNSRCSCVCIFTEHGGGHSVARQQAFHLKCITDFTWKEKMTAPSKSIQSGEIGRKQKKKHGQHRWRGTQMYWDYFWWSECIPKSSSLILAHQSFFPLANTMPFVPKRIIRQRCRRQTIYWHFASLNSNVSLPGTIHFKQYVCCTFLGCDTSQHSENHSS